MTRSQVHVSTYSHFQVNQSLCFRAVAVAGRVTFHPQSTDRYPTSFDLGVVGGTGHFTSGHKRRAPFKRSAGTEYNISIGGPRCFIYIFCLVLVRASRCECPSLPLPQPPPWPPKIAVHLRIGRIKTSARPATTSRHVLLRYINIDRLLIVGGQVRRRASHSTMCCRWARM